MEINEDFIEKYWFVYGEKDMHSAQLNCVPKHNTDELKCSLMYYLQGSDEDQFEGKGEAFEITVDINPKINLSYQTFEKKVKELQVHTKKIIDPVLIRYKGFSFAIGRMPGECPGDPITKWKNAEEFRTATKKLNNFCGVGLSMKRDEDLGELKNWIPLTNFSLSNSTHVFPEVSWSIRGNSLILGGREWRMSSRGETSTAVFMKKPDWTVQIKRAIDSYDNERAKDRNALGSLKARVSEAFKGFNVYPLRWKAQQTYTTNIMDSTHYVALQPDIIFYDGTPLQILVHLRTRIEFPRSLTENSGRD